MKKIALVLAMVLTLSFLIACAPEQNPTTEQPKTEDPVIVEDKYADTYTADIIIVGAGGGGLSSALEAVEQGAEKVIIIEKLTITGGSLNTTSGTISGAETIIQELDGLTEDSLASYKEDIMKEGSKHGGKPNEDLIDLYVEGAKESVNWLWEMGLKDYEFTLDKDGNKSVFAPEHTLFSYPRSYKAKVKDATKYKSAVHEILDGLVRSNSKIEIHFNTEAMHLLGNDQGQVLEVEAFNNQTKKDVLYKATKGIIMATGGYAANNELINHFNSEINGVITGGLLASNGYGIYMMQEVGGATNEESMTWVPTFPMGLENPNEPGTGRIMTTKTQFAGGILTNSDGNRFVNENDKDNVTREFELEKQNNGIQWEIYTDKILEDLLETSQGGMYKFFFMEDAGKKYIEKASSLEELAKIINVPEENLLKTVETYNNHVDAKGVDEFGRVYELDGNPFNLAVNKIEGENFYAVKIKPLAILTMGGMATDNNLNVLNEKGNVIPGLYAVGEVVGGVWGRFVSSGVGVMGPVVQGKQAARNLMATELKSGDPVSPASNLIDKKFFDKKESSAALEIDYTAKYTDGIYEATVDGQEGPMTVKVEIKNESIEKVEILSHKETESIASEALTNVPADIMANKSVDLISGATYTTNRIVEAVIKAIEGAKK